VDGDKFQLIRTWPIASEVKARRGHQQRSLALLTFLSISSRDYIERADRYGIGRSLRAFPREFAAAGRKHSRDFRDRSTDRNFLAGCTAYYRIAQGNRLRGWPSITTFMPTASFISDRRRLAARSISPSIPLLTLPSRRLEYVYYAYPSRCVSFGNR